MFNWRVPINTSRRDAPVDFLKVGEVKDDFDRWANVLSSTRSRPESSRALISQGKRENDDEAGPCLFLKLSRSSVRADRNSGGRDAAIHLFREGSGQKLGFESENSDKQIFYFLIFYFR